MIRHYKSIFVVEIYMLMTTYGYGWRSHCGTLFVTPYHNQIGKIGKFHDVILKVGSC